MVPLDIVLMVCCPFFTADIDECEDGNGGCSDTCNNRVGSYFCSCPAGFDIGSDQRTCEGTYGKNIDPHAKFDIPLPPPPPLFLSADVNECINNDLNNCQDRNLNSTCINTNGSYNCVCTGGFRGNLTTCLGW